MNSVFSFSRFWNVLKIQFRLDSKPLIINTVSTLTFYLFLLLTIDFVELRTSTWVLLCLTSVIGVLVLSTEICNNIRGKTKFLTFSVLPASNLEKFSVRLLICSIIPVTIWVLLSFLLYCNDTVSQLYRLNDQNMPIHIILCFLLLLSSSLCTFWGTMFRRLGIAAFIVMTTITIILIGNSLGDMNLMFLDPIMRFIMKDPTLGNLYIVIGGFSVLLTLINWTAAYFIYCRKEMNLKLLNW